MQDKSGPPGSTKVNTANHHSNHQDSSEDAIIAAARSLTRRQIIKDASAHQPPAAGAAIFQFYADHVDPGFSISLQGKDEVHRMAPGPPGLRQCQFLG